MLVIPPPSARNARQPDQTIVRALWTSATLVTICTLILSTVVLFYFYSKYERSRRNVEDIEYYRVILDAATDLAAERGPANSAMGQDDPGLPEKVANLALARKKTDASLIALAEPPLREQDHAIPEALLESLHHQLDRARQEVDAVISRPRDQRSYRDIQSAIDGMIAASDLMEVCLRWLSASLIAEDPDLAMPVLGGQILSELRDYTGRVASHIIAPIIVRQEMPLKNQIESRMTRGRVMELWRLLDLGIAAYPNADVITQKKLEFESRFFQEGLALVDRMIAEGTGKAAYSMTAGELSAAYVPTIRPVEEVRSAFLAAAVAETRSREQQSRYLFMAIAASTLVVILFMVGIAIAMQRFLFEPLLRASAMVIDLAEGRNPDFPDKPWRGAEMRRLLDSLAVLATRMREWAALVNRLKTEADTDGMTGLFNRAAFDRMVRNPSSLSGTCLILIDIDHFKSINDRFGHPAGDNVIRQIGELIRRELEPAHMAARFGGEEFAILFKGELQTSAALCEKLRHEISRMPVHFDGLVLPSVTASFGLALHRGEGFGALVRRADAALYRAKGDGRNRVCIGI